MQTNFSVVTFRRNFYPSRSSLLVLGVIIRFGSGLDPPMGNGTFCAPKGGDAHDTAHWRDCSSGTRFVSDTATHRKVVLASTVSSTNIRVIARYLLLTRYAVYQVWKRLLHKKQIVGTSLCARTIAHKCDKLKSYKHGPKTSEEQGCRAP